MNTQICKEDVDFIGSQGISLQGTEDYPSIPMCMISLYCDDDTANPLRYEVQLEGIKEKKTMFIMRHVETLHTVHSGQGIFVNIIANNSKCHEPILYPFIGL